MTNAHELLLPERTANMDLAPSTCSYSTVQYTKNASTNIIYVFFKHPRPHHISVWTTYIKLMVLSHQNEHICITVM